ncbi:MAG: beta-lactamase family protein [Clostridia bacterium]|nr:beta-lactamase family protein [Clostridia bacterium]
MSLYRDRLYLSAIAVVRPYISRKRSLVPDDKELRAILNRHAVLSGVVLDSDNVYLLGDGQADKLYRAASISKLVTAIGVMKMVEKERLSLDAPITSFTPLRLGNISLRQLLSHTSGLHDPPDYAKVSHTIKPLDALLSTFIMKPGPHPFRYSNFNFGILGSVIEYVTRQSAEVWMRQNVFEPLCFRGTYDTARATDASDSYRVMFPSKPLNVYQRALAAPDISSPAPQYHYRFTAGNLYTDAVSLRLILELLAGNGNGFLSAQSVHAMKSTQGQYGPHDRQMSYGLGMQIIRNDAYGPETLYGHQGFAYGSVHMAFFTESSRHTFISLNNGASEARDGRMGRLNHDLLAWAFGKSL